VTWRSERDRARAERRAAWLHALSPSEREAVLQHEERDAGRFWIVFGPFGLALLLALLGHVFWRPAARDDARTPPPITEQTPRE